MLENIDKIVGSKIRELRLSSGMTQSQLAERIGVTYQQIQKYEKGISSISIKRLFAIADTLNVSLKSFFEDLPVVEEEKVDYFLSKESIEVAKLINNISDQKLKNSIIQLIRLLSDTK